MRRGRVNYSRVAADPWKIFSWEGTGAVKLSVLATPKFTPLVLSRQCSRDTCQRYCWCHYPSELHNSAVYTYILWSKKRFSRRILGSLFNNHFETTRIWFFILYSSISNCKKYIEKCRVILRRENTFVFSRNVTVKQFLQCQQLTSNDYFTTPNRIKHRKSQQALTNHRIANPRTVLSRDNRSSCIQYRAEKSHRARARIFRDYFIHVYFARTTRTTFICYYHPRGSHVCPIAMAVPI